MRGWKWNCKPHSCLVDKQCGLFVCSFNSLHVLSDRCSFNPVSPHCVFFWQYSWLFSVWLKLEICWSFMLRYCTSHLMRKNCFGGCVPCVPIIIISNVLGSASLCDDKPSPWVWRTLFCFETWEKQHKSFNLSHCSYPLSVLWSAEAYLSFDWIVHYRFSYSFFF